MSTQVSWYCPERVVYVYVSGILTIEQIAEGHRRNIELMESVSYAHKLHFIFDSSAMKQGPTNFLEIRRAGREFFAHPRLGWSIGVGDTTLIRFVSSTIAQLTGVKHRGFHYLEQGIEFLQAVDLTLPELSQRYPESEALYTIEAKD